MRRKRYLPIVALLAGLFAVVNAGHAQSKTTDTMSSQTAQRLQAMKRFNEVEQAALSDLVVIGDVVGKVNIPGPRTEFFHSKVLVKVDSVLRGQTPSDTLVLLLESGPISDKIAMRVSTDGTFDIGEHAVFFLKRPETDSYMQAMFSNSRYKTFFGKRSLALLPKNSFWGGHGRAFLIENDTVFYASGSKDLNEFIRNIEKLKGDTKR